MADVTVLMSVYNGMPYLPDAVESILRQTLDDWSLVVVNDGSTDASGDYLERLEDPRITVIHSANAGLGAALNRGLRECRSEFVARMDSDDVAHPDRLALQHSFLRQETSVGLVGTQIERMGDDRVSGRSVLPTRHSAILSHLMSGMPAVYHPTIMCRTDLLKRIGGYWSLRFGEEWDMFLRMGEVAKLANLEEVLLSHRFDVGSMTGANMYTMRMHIDYAIDRARRRRSSLPAVSYEEFELARKSGSWLQRAQWAAEVYARGQYRRAVGDLLGSRRFRGYLRLAWAALCSPKLTLQRVAREVGARLRAVT